MRVPPMLNPAAQDDKKKKKAEEQSAAAVILSRRSGPFGAKHGGEGPSLVKNTGITSNDQESEKILPSDTRVQEMT